MHFLLNPLGSIGDVNPYLGIGSVLGRRGHRVTVIANPYYQSRVREAGLEFAPLGTAEELQEYWENPDMWHPWRHWKVSLDYCALRLARQSYRIIAELYEPGETVLAAPGWAFGARIARDKLRVPMATIYLEPYWIRSLHRTALMPRPLVLGPCVPRISKRIQLWMADVMFIDRFLGPVLNEFRAELGLPPVRRFLADWWHSPDRIIGLFPEWFYQSQPDWPTQTVLTGFPLWDRVAGAEMSEEAVRFLDEGTPPIVFTPGTPNRHAGRFFAAAVEACRLLGRRGMLMTNCPRQIPDRLPDGVRHFSYEPFSRLLPRAAAVVHHAGTGTTAQGLAEGIPQLVVPMAFSQPDMALHLVRLGVARRLRPKALGGRAFARELDRLLQSPQVSARCRDLAANFHGSSPIERTCDLLEELVERKAVRSL